MTGVRIESERAAAAADALATSAKSTDPGLTTTGSTGPVPNTDVSPGRVPTIGEFPPAASAIAQLADRLDATDASVRAQSLAAAVELRAVVHEAIAADA